MGETIKSLLQARITPWLLLAATLAGVLPLVLRDDLQIDPRSPEVDVLYARIHARGREYHDGLALIATGDQVMGKNLLYSATDRLIKATDDCSRTPGCDVGLVLDAMSAVLDERRIALSERDRRGPPRNAPREASMTLGDAKRPAPSPPPAIDSAAATGDPAANPAESVADVAADAVLESAVEQVHRAVSLFEMIDLERLVAENVAVKRALNDWTTWNRPTLIEAYENYLFLREETARLYERAGLPEGLLFALIAQETGGKVHAYSRAGAAGPLQFMPRTGKRYGLVRVGDFDMRLDPVAATRASAEYLNDQLRRFNNDLTKALAAYNGGESRLAKLDRKLDGAAFWDPELYLSLPDETREYVPAVLAAAWLYHRPETYGVTLPEAESGITTIELEQEISIGELTICLGQEQTRTGWFRTLRNLNPRVAGDERIEAGEPLKMPSMLVPSYVERCAGGSELLARARELHDAAYQQGQGRFEYTVKTGDSLSSIARRFGCSSASALAKLNRLTGDESPLRVGQRIVIPTCS